MPELPDPVVTTADLDALAVDLNEHPVGKPARYPYTVTGWIGGGPMWSDNMANPGAYVSPTGVVDLLHADPSAAPDMTPVGVAGCHAWYELTKEEGTVNPGDSQVEIRRIGIAVHRASLNAWQVVSASDDSYSPLATTNGTGQHGRYADNFSADGHVLAGWGNTSDAAGSDGHGNSAPFTFGKVMVGEGPSVPGDLPADIGTLRAHAATNNGWSDGRDYFDPGHLGGAVNDSITADVDGVVAWMQGRVVGADAAAGQYRMLPGWDTMPRSTDVPGPTEGLWPGHWGKTYSLTTEWRTLLVYTGSPAQTAAWTAPPIPGYVAGGGGGGGGEFPSGAPSEADCSPIVSCGGSLTQTPAVTIDFGDMRQGSGASRVVQWHNDTGAPVTVTSFGPPTGEWDWTPIDLDIGNDGSLYDWYWSGGQFATLTSGHPIGSHASPSLVGATIADGDTLSVLVHYSPATSDLGPAVAGSLSIGFGATVFTTSLVANMVADTSPATGSGWSTTPTHRFLFGTVIVGDVVAVPVNGTPTLTVTAGAGTEFAVGISPPSAPFSLDSTTIVVGVPPVLGDPQTFHVSFSPTAPGYFEDSLMVWSSGGAPIMLVTFEGDAVCPDIGVGEFVDCGPCGTDIPAVSGGNGAIVETGGFVNEDGTPLVGPIAVGDRWWFDAHYLATGTCCGAPWLVGEVIPVFDQAILGGTDYEAHRDLGDVAWTVDYTGPPIALPIPFDSLIDPGSHPCPTPVVSPSGFDIARRSGIAVAAGAATLSTYARQFDVTSNLLCSSIVVLPPAVAPGVDPNDCLGSGRYTVEIVRRPTALGTGGPYLPGRELEVKSGSWGRKLSKQSAASVVLAADPTCCETLAALDPSTDEMELWRDASLVWSGPVLDVVDNRDGTVLISAADSHQYVGEERVAVPRSWTGVDLSTVFAEMVGDALAVDNPGITFVVEPTGIIGTRIVDAKDVKKLGGELSELERTAVDWTVTARTWWVGGQTVSGTTRLPLYLTDEDFASPPKVRLSRSAMATEVIVRGNGVIGRYGGPRSDDGVLIQKIVDENSIADTASANAAAKTLWDRIHEPVLILDGSSAQLSPSAPLDIQTLIPGAIVPVAVGDCLQFNGDMRLDSVDVRFDATSEAVTIGLQPLGTTGETG